MRGKAILDYVSLHKEKIDLAIGIEIEKRLNEVETISPHLDKVVRAMQELAVGGKRLRGLLTLLGYELAGGEVNGEIYKAAAVMELFHLGLLIQDDMMDRDEKRRGVPTIHTRYDDRHVGNFVAMLAGDYTFGWTVETIASLRLASGLINASLRVWGKYMTRVGYGQTLDGLSIADEETVLKILAIKSGEYSCVMPLILGATLGGADKELLSRLEEYGMELGWVFQLRDDWLSEYGDSSKTGKPVGNDRREGRKSYATLYGREKTEEAIKEHWEKGKTYADGSEVMLGLLEWMAAREN